MRYSVLALSAVLVLSSVSDVAAQTSLRDDLDRATGVAVSPSSVAPHAIQGAPQAPNMPQYMGHDYMSEPVSSIETEAGQLARLNQTAPDFTLMIGNANAAGSSLSLKDIISRGPAVILFAPGTIAYTYPLFGLLEKNLSNFQRVGIHPVAVSTDPVTVLRNQNLHYTTLSDPSGLTMRHYGAIKQGNVVNPVLVSINAQGVIVDIQETLNPDLNRAVRALQRAETVSIQSNITETTTVQAIPSTTENASEPNPLLNIRQVAREDDVVVNAQGQVVAGRETLLTTRETINMNANTNVAAPQFPPVTQEIPSVLPPADLQNYMPAAPVAMPPPAAQPHNQFVPNVPPAYVETQVQSY